MFCTTNLNAYGAQQAHSPEVGKFPAADLDTALSSLADNLSVGTKTAASQGKPVQWNNQGGVRPATAPHSLVYPQFGAPPPQQWPSVNVYPSQPGIYSQQPVMGLYPQSGYNPQIQQPVAPGYAVSASNAPFQAGQSQHATSAPPPSHHSFM
ncbi:unnamed protein product [Thelazia callipaeda]|uniref:PAM2 domain-containing protein n=1 Tax=Thelazia callipaeda TaxID=103827 RepID=A0A0N5CTW3_THECL|nr:unnamed protein product [Thelazia callipaeda]